MDINITPEKRKFRLTPDERAFWNENGYFVRYDVFSKEENDFLSQVADDIALGKIPYPDRHIHQNALVRDGKVEASGIHAMHSIYQMNLYSPEFLARARDPRLTDPIVDVLGPDLLSLTILYIWKPPKIGLGFPWHQDRWYTQSMFKTPTTVGTWAAIDAADIDNGCLYVIPGSHKDEILEHVELEGSQQQEFKLALGAKDEDGVAIEVPPGSVIFFDNRLLHKSTDNTTERFRRCSVAHYLSAKAERTLYKNVKHILPVSWVRGKVYPTLSDEVHHDTLPISESE
ncbi:MAG: phytanoyl-CoA dioxygenase family protein [Candidatus Poribacteria bacterium]|nr:phytanoyl-CoA dioxygenase family protein [Candidatus Poribacteria bacterium]